MVKFLFSKNMWISFLFHYLSSAALLYYLIILWQTYPLSIGGTLIFMSIIGINYYFSIIYKQFAVELGLFSLSLVSLMGLNFLAYIEYANGFSETILIGTLVATFIIAITILYLTNSPFGPRETSNSPIFRIELRKRITGLIGHSSAVAFGFPVITASVFMGIRDEPIIKENVLSFPTLSLMWVVIGLMLGLALMRKQKDLNNYIRYLVVKKSEINIAFLKKWFFPINIGIFIVGLVFEINRGFWFLWLYSWLAFLLILILGWKIWKYVFQKNSYEITTIETEKVLSIPSYSDPKYFLKFVGIFTAVGFFYFIILMAIALYFNKY